MPCQPLEQKCMAELNIIACESCMVYALCNGSAVALGICLLINFQSNIRSILDNEEQCWNVFFFFFVIRISNCIQPRVSISPAHSSAIGGVHNNRRDMSQHMSINVARIPIQKNVCFFFVSKHIQISYSCHWMKK